MLQKLKAYGLVFVLAMLSSTAAHAMLMDYEFDGSFYDGPLNGDTFAGTFTLDGVEGSSEDFYPSGSVFSDAVHTVSAFTVTIDGQTFVMADEVNEPDYPWVEASLSAVTLIEFLGELASGPSVYIFYEAGITNYVDYTPDVGDVTLFSSGTISRIAPVSGVPEPSTIALLSLGLAGLGFTRRRMKA